MLWPLLYLLGFRLDDSCVLLALNRSKLRFRPVTFYEIHMKSITADVYKITRQNDSHLVASELEWENLDIFPRISHCTENGHAYTGDNL